MIFAHSIFLILAGANRAYRPTSRIIIPIVAIVEAVPDICMELPSDA